MTQTQTKPIPIETKQERAWNRYSVYMSDRMIAAAKRLATAEHERTGRQVGVGQILDRAMRQYVAEGERQ